MVSLHLQYKAQAIGGDRQMKSLEKSVQEWKRKCSDLQAELDGAGGDARSAAADAFRYKSEVEERDDQIEALRREIRGLSECQPLNLKITGVTDLKYSSRAMKLNE